MVKGSRNREKQHIRVAKLHEKVANQRKDFLHKQSRQIANVYDCVCIENLNMQAMAQSMNFGKSVSDNGWGGVCHVIVIIDTRITQAFEKIRKFKEITK